MAGATLTEIMTEIRGNLGGRTDLDAALPGYINEAQLKIARIFDFREMRRTTSGKCEKNSRFIPVPQNYKSINSLTMIVEYQSRKLTKLTPAEYDMMIPNPQILYHYIPTHYMIWEGMINLYPVPDQEYDYAMRYIAWPDKLTEPDDRTGYDGKDDILTAFATARAYKRLKMPEDAADFNADAKGALAAAINAALIDPDEDYVNIRNRAFIAAGGDYWNDPFVKEAP
jgi:hypothetical protein